MELDDYYTKNRERILMRNRLYRMKNKEKIRRLKKRYLRKLKAGLIRQKKRQNIGRSYIDLGYK